MAPAMLAQKIYLKESGFPDLKFPSLVKAGLSAKLPLKQVERMVRMRVEISGKFIFRWNI